MLEYHMIKSMKLFNYHNFSHSNKKTINKFLSKFEEQGLYNAS